MTSSDTNPDLPLDEPATERRKRRAGNIFAVDQRAWAAACNLGLNAAVAYLVLARGTGGDQRTVGWSVNAIESRTGIGRPNARKAIEKLIAGGLVRRDRGGTKPRYYLLPAHELPGAASGRRTDLTPSEERVLAAIRAGHRRPPRTRGGEIWGPGNCHAIAMGLERAGWVRSVGYQVFEPVEAPPVEEAPDWIWLPNAIIDGADGETPPVDLIRQSQNLAALRLFIDLYHAHELRDFGGVNWRPGSNGIRQLYKRNPVGEYGEYVIWGFEAGNWQAGRDAPFVAPHITPDGGWDAFWDAFRLLVTTGLLEMVPTLVESYSQEGEPILSLSQSGGDEGERDVAWAAISAAEAMLVDWKLHRLENEDHWILVPVLRHLTNVQMVGVARLRYRPHTEAVGSWYARHSVQCREWADRYRAIEDAIRGVSSGVQHQGGIKA